MALLSTLILTAGVPLVATYLQEEAARQKNEAADLERQLEAANAVQTRVGEIVGESLYYTRVALYNLAHKASELEDPEKKNEVRETLRGYQMKVAEWKKTRLSLKASVTEYFDPSIDGLMNEIDANLNELISSVNNTYYHGDPEGKTHLRDPKLAEAFKAIHEQTGEQLQSLCQCMIADIRKRSQAHAQSERKTLLGSLFRPSRD